MASDPITAVASAADDALKLAQSEQDRANTPQMQQAAIAKLSEEQREKLLGILNRLLENPDDDAAMQELRSLIA
jgi:hypothetical protein